MHSRLPGLRLVLATALVVVAGCASTQVETTGSSLKEPLCRVGERAVVTAVVWGPQWRPDQK